MTNNTPIDEYYFWKSLIEDKQDAGELVSDRMFELLALAEVRMAHFLTKKNKVSGENIKPNLMH